MASINKFNSILTNIENILFIKQLMIATKTERIDIVELLVNVYQKYITMYRPKASEIIICVNFKVSLKYANST